MENAFWALMDEYRNIFGEYFPTMQMYGMKTEEIMKEIKKCIDSRTPYGREDVDGEI